MSGPGGMKCELLSVLLNGLVNMDPVHGTGMDARTGCGICLAASVPCWSDLFLKKDNSSLQQPLSLSFFSMPQAGQTAELFLNTPQPAGWSMQ